MKFRGLLIVILLSGASIAHAHQPWAWEPQRAVATDLSLLSEGAIAAWQITPQTEGFSARQVSLSLDLPGRGQLTASHRRSFERGPGQFTWIGHLEPYGTDVVLTVHDGLIAGLVYTDQQVFELRAGSRELGPIMLELDQSRFPSCDGGFEPPADFRDPARAPRPTTSAAPAASLQVPDASGTVVMDLIVFYTPAARQQQGGVSQIETMAHAAVANANTAFINSEVDAEFRVVLVAELAFNETSNCSSDLASFRNNATAQALRNEYHADMVGLLIQPNYCGCGYVMRNPGPGFAGSAFQVTGTHCAVGNLTYAHEHGHNMGMEHDPANGASPSTASYPWSFGHFQSGSFRTVMSYANQCSNCPRRMYFSNPSVSFQGNPTGIADQRDNARTARLTAPIIADFRIPPAGAEPEISVQPSSFAFTIDEGGSGSDSLLIANTALSGAADLIWDVQTAAAMVTLTETFDLPPFVIEPLADGGSAEIFSFAGGEINPGAVVGLRFEGDASGVSGNGDWASDTCMIVEAPDGTTLSFGGVSATVPGFPACNAASTLPWDFQGDVSNQDGFYQSVHADVFGAGVDDAGTWRFSFVHAWNSQSANPISWDNVAISLIKDSAICDAPNAIGWLNVDPDSGTTAAGSSSPVNLSLDATGLPVGNYSAVLCINSNDPDESLVAVPVSLTVAGATPGLLQVAPSGLEFGAIEVGDSAMLAFSVSNAAAPEADSLMLTSIAVSGPPDFEITGGSCEAGITTLAPAESCTVQVSYTPTEDIAYAGSVLIQADNDQDVSVSLSGLPGSLFADRFEVNY